MWGNSISKRVARVIAQRTRDAQKKHDEHCKQLTKQFEDAKEAHATEMVLTILGK